MFGLIHSLCFKDRVRCYLKVEGVLLKSLNFAGDGYHPQIFSEINHILLSWAQALHLDGWW